MMTTKEQLNNTSRVAAFMSSETRGYGDRSDPHHLPGHLEHQDQQLGGISEPEERQSDMAVSRQVTTPSITGRDGASWTRRGHLMMASPTPMNA